MKEIKLTPYTEYGSMYKKPFFIPWGDGKWKTGYALRFMLVATANFDLFSEPYDWTMTTNTKVSYKIRDTEESCTNAPLRAEDGSLTELPKDAFKVKAEIIPGGEITVSFMTGEYVVEFPISYGDAVNFKDDVEDLEMVFEIPDEIPEDPEPEIPEPEIPAPDIEPAVTGFWDAIKQVIKEFLNKSKWFVLAYLIGLFTPTIIKVLNFIFKIF